MVYPTLYVLVFSMLWSPSRKCIIAEKLQDKKYLKDLKNDFIIDAASSAGIQSTLQAAI